MAIYSSHIFEHQPANPEPANPNLPELGFDEYGFQKFFKIDFRNAGGVPTRDKIPAHFAVREHNVETSNVQDGHGWAELASLVPLSHGGRLLRLFMQRVFPLLPILSRSHLGICQDQDIAGPLVLEKIPPVLLAAVYATALPFASEDELLSLTAVYEEPPTSKLWNFVHELIICNMHTPRLAALQAAILYVHRTAHDGKGDTNADTTSTWCMMGIMVGLAHSLGLNLECRMFGLPPQEKRLRRRVWWALYNEDKWMSIMFGRPPYIHSAEWDVAELDELDFVSTPSCNSWSNEVGSVFRSATSLAIIAQSVQESLYSLRACQRLAEDITASVEVAKPLLHSLGAWRESLNIPGNGVLLHETMAAVQKSLPATIYHAYLVLLVLVWRALLRTTVRSCEPPQVIDLQDLLDPTASLFRDLDWGFNYLPEVDIRAENPTEKNTIAEELYEASMSCATSILDFNASLDYSTLSQFWYSYMFDVGEDQKHQEGGITGWVVVFGAWCAMVPSMGLLNTHAILQAWIKDHELKGLPESKLGWIFSSYAFFLYFCGAQVGPIFDAHDVRFLVIPGSFGMVLSLIFMKLYQFLLSFGVLGGISASLLFNPGLAAIGQWFDERRAFATGIACTAGGLGGVAFPLVILYLAPHIGLPWALRTIALICLVLLSIACLTLRKRLPNNKKAGASVDFRALRDPRFAIVTLSVFLIEFAVFIPYTYIVSYALHSGFDTHRAYLLNVALNVGAVPGRAIPGYAADRFGSFNTMCFTAFICAVSVWTVWLTAGNNEAQTMAFTVLFGFFSGAAISLTPICVSRVCLIEDYGKRNGTAFFVASFGQAECSWIDVHEAICGLMSIILNSWNTLVTFTRIS
ncbi:riboflavin transporter MCH5 [Paramyrothecium foliicola]|nr:riboflavin transporter MCH5 [Paramyrothecium foliicola]